MNKQEIEKAIEYFRAGNFLGKSMDKHINVAISVLEQQLNNGWIPVSERLPDEHKRYLVSMKHKSLNETFIDCRYYDPDYQFEYQDSLERHNWEVTAWQPLPEPYKEVKDEERN